MENQRKNSGAEQEKQRQLLQKAQEAIKTATKDMKDIKQKVSQVIVCDFVSDFLGPDVNVKSGSIIGDGLWCRMPVCPDCFLCDEQVL